MTRKRQYKPFRISHFIAVLALASIALFPLALRAEAPTSTDSFNVRVSEKEDMLAYDDVAVQIHLMKDLSFQRTMSRNKPFVELSNDEDSDDPITQFRMTIGDSRFHFSDDFLGEFALVGKTTPDVKITSTIMSNGDELVIDIDDGGLEPGKTVRFKIDIDVDSEYADEIFAYPDYRTVLFDMNGFEMYGPDPGQSGPEDNSFVSALFDVAGSDSLLTDPVPFKDPTIAPEWAAVYNDLTCGCCSIGLVPLDVPNQVTGDVTPIPEPGSLVLATFGLLGAAGICRRSRRCHSASAT